jgi:hypothetical protein
VVMKTCLCGLHSELKREGRRPDQMTLTFPLNPLCFLPSVTGLEARGVPTPFTYCLGIYYAC